MARKKTKNVYWNEAKIADAIQRYNSAKTQEHRDRIYVEELDAPMKKLVEYVFNTYKFDYLTDWKTAQDDCLTHIVCQLPKFDPNRDSQKHKGEKAKAFSYFSWIAKNYLILSNDRCWKHKCRSVSIDTTLDEKDISHRLPLELREDFKLSDDMPEAQRKLKAIVASFRKKPVETHVLGNSARVKKIVSCICDIATETMEAGEHSGFKKELYAEVRKRLGCNTVQISKAIKLMNQRISGGYFEMQRD